MTDPDFSGAADPADPAPAPAVYSSALATLIDANEQLVAIKDTGTWRYVHVSERMAALLGQPAARIVGCTDAELLDGAKVAALRVAEISAVAAHPAPSRAEHRFDVAGTRRDFVVWRVGIASVDSNAPELQLSLWTENTRLKHHEVQLRAALAQVEEAQRAQVELRELRDHQHDASLRDAATGLFRHGHFQDQLRREIDLSSREHREFSLVSIALDAPDERLKSAGFEGRQRVLEALGRLLKQNTRAMDASCRLDEEHFSVLLSGVGLATAHSRMDGLRRQCAAQVVVQDGQEMGFTISMGISSFPHTSTDQEELIYAADKALVQAVAKGNHVSLASITLG